MRLPHSAKVLGACLFLHFNYQRWRETGVLDAGGQEVGYGGLGFRKISEETGLPHSSIDRAAKALEKAGLLRIVRSPRDPVTGQRGANSYFAKFPSNSAEPVASRSQTQVANPGCATLPKPLYNLSVTSDQNIPYALHTASVADATRGTQKNISDEGKGNSKKGRRLSDAYYSPEDVETVRDSIVCYGDDRLFGYQSMSIGALVECRRSFGEDISGGAIRAMCRDGHFGLNRKDHVFLLDEDAA